MDKRKLGPRLNAVASFVPNGSRVADIGTDHAHLPIWLRTEKISPMVIASDIRPGPLNTARLNVEKSGVDGICFRLCPGLRDIRPDEADTVVIAGMSGETIRSILENANWDWKCKRLILEANTKHALLLSWIYANDLHVDGKPEVFRPGFCDELRDYIHVIREDPRKEIVVAVLEDAVCGFAVLNHVTRPENPFMFERDYLDIDEFGVDENCRRRGAASAMIRFIRDYAREKGYRRLELNMWEFNRGALAFYEAAGFSTYRRYMEIRLD